MAEATLPFPITLADILKDTNYKLTQFSHDKINELKDNLVIREVRGKPVPYLKCHVRNKEIKLTLEESNRMKLLPDIQNGGHGQQKTLYHG